MLMCRSAAREQTAGGQRRGEPATARSPTPAELSSGSQAPVYRVPERARLRLGGPRDAADDVAAARRQGAACGNRWQQALADHIAGRIAQARGELNQAAALLRRALVLRVEAGYRPDAAGSLEALASLHVARGEDAAVAAASDEIEI
jgi:hypothetical protein